MPMWTEAIGRMQKRMEDTRRRVGSAYPHWADPETGAWTTTADGDWTGGFWAGMHWLASKHTGEENYRAQAAALAQGLKNRIAVDTVFKSFPLYFGAALGAILYDDRSAKELALAGARSLAAMYNPALKLVPLGSQAEEGGHVGNIETSIDSLHAAPFLFWAARAAGDEKMREVAHAHAATIIPLHRRADDSFIQSSTLDATGRLVKHSLPHPMQRLQVELIGALRRDKLHRRTLHRLRYRLGIAEVILLPLRIGSHILRPCLCRFGATCKLIQCNKISSSLDDLATTSRRSAACCASTAARHLRLHDHGRCGAWARP